MSRIMAETAHKFDTCIAHFVIIPKLLQEISRLSHVKLIKEPGCFPFHLRLKMNHIAKLQRIHILYSPPDFRLCIR